MTSLNAMHTLMVAFQFVFSDPFARRLRQTRLHESLPPPCISEIITLTVSLLLFSVVVWGRYYMIQAYRRDFGRVVWRSWRGLLKFVSSVGGFSFGASRGGSFRGGKRAGSEGIYFLGWLYFGNGIGVVEDMSLMCWKVSACCTDKRRHAYTSF